MSEGIQRVEWWGYVHVNGSIQAKRLFSKDDIHEAQSSPFAREVYGPFFAISRDDAIDQIRGGRVGLAS